jgi:hypothetical protein
MPPADHVVQIDQKAGGVGRRGVVVAGRALVRDDRTHEVLVGQDLRLGAGRRATIVLGAHHRAAAAGDIPLEDVVAVQIDAVMAAAAGWPGAGSRAADAVVAILAPIPGVAGVGRL